MDPDYSKSSNLGFQNHSETQIETPRKQSSQLPQFPLTNPGMIRDSHFATEKLSVLISLTFHNIAVSPSLEFWCPVKSTLHKYINRFISLILY